ncbi:spexin prohormone 2-like [Ranitomeya imitator]|uniref:spexin prohormone 2-like n=1 Tax=Ranitomeya imitator TaxID=111125 RepID=UPI0037E951BB
MRASSRMTRKAALFFTCAVFLFILSESMSAPKNKLMARNWGPQSMLYLKGRHGRRFVSDYEEQYQKLNLDTWDAILKRCLFVFGTENKYTRLLWNLGFKRKKTQWAS